MKELLGRIHNAKPPSHVSIYTVMVTRNMNSNYFSDALSCITFPITDSDYIIYPRYGIKVSHRCHVDIKYISHPLMIWFHTKFHTELQCFFSYHHQTEN
jgi:hypothetical protein